jgi:lipoyl(octanoyl) transferase
MNPPLHLDALGRISYRAAEQRQSALRQGILADLMHERFLLCEHDPVVTMGRSARLEHLLVSERELIRRGVALCRSQRGGDLTYHGPGQLVGYPVVRLRHGVTSHVEAMAAALVETLSALGVSAEWRRECPGVWIGGDKVAAFGVHVHRGVAIHGFALNVTIDPGDFAVIVPCGIRSGGVTSLARHLEPPGALALGRSIAQAFAEKTGHDLVVP